jgi:hypothetical protein
MNIIFSESDLEKIKKWEAKLPKYKKIQYDQTYTFDHGSGIGWACIVTRNYNNGRKFTLDLTDVNSW